MGGAAPVPPPLKPPSSSVVVVTQPDGSATVGICRASSEVSLSLESKPSSPWTEVDLESGVADGDGDGI